MTLPPPIRSLTPRGRLTLPLGLLLVALGIWWRYPVVVGLGGVLFLLVLAELVAVHNAAAVGVAREVTPRVVTRNDACHGQLHLTGRRRSGLARIDAADQVDGTLVPVPLLDDPSADGASLGYPIPTTRRGLIDVGPVQLRRTGLTGMAARSEETGDVLQVRVLPRRIPLGSMARGHRRAANGADDSLELGGTDLVGLHEYTVGDDLRRLHWPTSARTGTLMVREDADPSEPHVFVLLDDRASSYPDHDHAAEQFEEAVEIADALCRSAVDAGNPLRFRTATGRHEIDVPGSASGQPRPEAQELAWLLAEIDATAGDVLADLGTRDLDIFATVTGTGCNTTEVALASASAITQVVLVVDPAPVVGVEPHGGLVILRGRTSVELASAWDRTVAR